MLNAKEEYGRKDKKQKEADIEILPSDVSLPIF